jgi:hypothetical protein
MIDRRLDRRIVAADANAHKWPIRRRRSAPHTAQTP